MVSVGSVYKVQMENCWFESRLVDIFDDAGGTDYLCFENGVHLVPHEGCTFTEVAPVPPV